MADIREIVTARLVVAPFDIVKIRMQLHPASAGPLSLTQCCRQIWRAEPFSGFWRGNVPATMLWASYLGIQFPVYEATKRQLRSRGPLDSSFAIDMAAGAAAGSITTALTYPFDTLRTQLAAHPGPRQALMLLTTIRQVYDGYGVRGFYGGFGPAMAQIAPYIGLQFALYHALDKYWQHISSVDGRWSVLVAASKHFAAGGVAGLGAKLAVYPLDTIKRRMQVRTVAFTRHAAYESAMHAARSMWRAEGWRAFYRGLLPALLKSSPGSAVAFTVYSTTLDMMRGQ